MIALIITLVVVFIVGFAWGYGIWDMMSSRRKSFEPEQPVKRPVGCPPVPPPAGNNSAWADYMRNRFPSYYGRK